MRRAAGAVGLGTALVLAAATFGSASLYVPGVGLALLGVLAAVWVGLAGRARLERTLGPPRISEEEPYPVRLATRGWLPPPPGSTLEEPLLARSLPVAGRRTRRAQVNVHFARRGRRAVAPARLVVRDPLGLAERTIVSAPGEVLVLPRVEPVTAGAGGGADAAAGRTAGSRASEGAEVELDALRPYRPGAPASRIHWPTVARTGTMVERRLVSDSDLRPLVVLDPRRPASEEALDRAVRAAASLCVHLAAPAGVALLLPGDRRVTEIDPALHAWPAAHARLALVEAGDRPPAPPRADRGGAIFWVTADPARDPRRGLPRAFAGATAGERFLVQAAPMPGGRSAFSVAGCTGHRLGRGRRSVAA